MKKNKEQPKEINECVCGICNKIIFRKIDNYCNLLDYYKGNFVQEGFYHTKCYNDKIKGNAELDSMKKKTMQLLDGARKMLGMKDEEPMEVIRI